MTHAGALLGTPGYMAPESWRGEKAMPQSDVYSLGALLFELCAGRPPHGDVMPHALSSAVQDRDAPLLTEIVPDVDPAFAQVIARCLARNPYERYASGEHLHEALARPAPGACSEPVTGNPYRGLRRFEGEHRALFFGRHTEIRTIVERLQDASMVVVTGDSGVGKSSLCRAGVLPAVENGALDGGRKWRTVCVAPGRAPLLSLSRALAGRLDLDEAAVARWLREQPRTLTCAICERLGDDTGLVLCVDPIEDLVASCDAVEGAMVAEALGHLATSRSGLRLLLTVRSDALARVAGLPVLGEEVGRAFDFLQPLPPEGIREVIIGPARAVGVALASETCVEILIRAMSRSRGALPLVELVFAELWEARDTGAAAITAASLDKIGGLESALARHAEEVILGMTAVNRAAARSILTRLVGPQGTPIVRFEQELVGAGPAERAALECLVKGRLLVSGASGEEVTYELAHEALVRNWDTLRRWLSEQAESRDVRARIGVAAAAWEQQGRAEGALWEDDHLLEELRVIDPDDLTPREFAFVRASREAIGRRSRAYRVRARTLALAEAFWGVHRWVRRAALRERCRWKSPPAAAISLRRVIRRGRARPPSESLPQGTQMPIVGLEMLAQWSPGGQAGDPAVMSQYSRHTPLSIESVITQPDPGAQSEAGLHAVSGAGAPGRKADDARRARVREGDLASEARLAAGAADRIAGRPGGARADAVRATVAGRAEVAAGAAVARVGREVHARAAAQGLRARGRRGAGPGDARDRRAGTRRRTRRSCSRRSRGRRTRCRTA